MATFKAKNMAETANNGSPAMADRIFSTRCTDYQRIEASDITKAFEKYNPKAIGLKSRRHVVTGFTT